MVEYSYSLGGGAALPIGRGVGKILLNQNVRNPTQLKKIQY